MRNFSQLLKEIHFGGNREDEAKVMCKKNKRAAPQKYTREGYCIIVCHRGKKKGRNLNGHPKGSGFVPEGTSNSWTTMYKRKRMSLLSLSS